MSQAQRPKIYLMLECPYCLKLRIFLSEARLEDQVEFVVFHKGDELHQQVRNQMLQAGQKPSFPAAELEPGRLTPETDHLIAHFAEPLGLDPKTLPLLSYYLKGIFPDIIASHRELRELKGEA